MARRSLAPSIWCCTEAEDHRYAGKISNLFFSQTPISLAQHDSANGRGQPLSDEELTALALGTEVVTPIGGDAVVVDPCRGESTLPNWYMPAVTVRAAARWQRSIIYTVVAAFLVIEAFGLCTTFG